MHNVYYSLHRTHAHGQDELSSPTNQQQQNPNNNQQAQHSTMHFTALVPYQRMAPRQRKDLQSGAERAALGSHALHATQLLPHRHKVAVPGSVDHLPDNARTGGTSNSRSHSSRARCLKQQQLRFLAPQPRPPTIASPPRWRDQHA